MPRQLPTFVIATTAICAAALLPAQSPDIPAQTKPYQRASAATSDNYPLGPGDQIAISVTDLEDFNDKIFRIDLSGDLTLPQAGRVHASGFTAPALEEQLRTRLSRILKDPQVVVSIASYGSQPVSILGAVNSPGIRQVEGRKSLFEVLSLAGGLRTDAGYLIRITREAKWGAIPLPGVQVDSVTGVTTASVKVRDIMNASNMAANIPIFPGDTISIPRADVVYAVGSVVKSGGFLLNEHETLSALQVVSLAEGLSKTADGKKARIIRTLDGAASRTEIPVDLKLLLAGKGQDVQLQAGDILFIPNNNAKSAGYRTLDIIASAAGGAVYAAK